MTRDRSIWLQLYFSPQNQYQLGYTHEHNLLPLPKHFRTNPATMLDLPSEPLERIITATLSIAQRWPVPRTHYRPTPIERLKPSQLGEAILLLQTFFDRWLVCVYVGGAIAVWDLGPPLARRAPVVFRGVVRLSEDISWSCAVGAEYEYEEDDGEDGAGVGMGRGIVLALTRTGG
jgi:hypothetical protein